MNKTNIQIYASQVKDFSEKQLRLLKMLISKALCSRNVYLSCETMADTVGVSSRTIKRYLNLFRDLELVKTTYRHMQSSIYIFPEEIKTQSFVKRLNNLLKQFNCYIYLPFAVLFSSQNTDGIGHVTQVNIKDNKYHNAQSLKRAKVLNYIGCNLELMENLAEKEQLNWADAYNCISVSHNWLADPSPLCQCTSGNCEFDSIETVWVDTKPLQSHQFSTCVGLDPLASTKGELANCLDVALNVIGIDWVP